MNETVKSAALSHIAARKRNAEQAWRYAVAKLRETEPELAEIEQLLTSLGAKIAMTALGGNAEAVAALRERAERLESKKTSILKKHHLEGGPDYTCKKCRDTGYVGSELCTCAEAVGRTILLERLFENIKEIPTFEGFDLSLYPDHADENGRVPRDIAATTLRITKEFAGQFPEGKNLLFIGGCGLGKTHLSLAVAGTVALNGYDVIYGSAGAILNKAVRESMDWDGDGSYLNRLLTCDLLVIDDLGTEIATNPGNAILYQIINGRLSAGRSTIVNTNMSLHDLEKRYDPRIVSRFTGGYIQRGFLGNDIRQIKKNAE